MGRQIQLHMLPGDTRMLLKCIQEHDPVVVTLRSSDTPDVTPVADPVTEADVMALWNRNLLAFLERKLVLRPGGKDYYRVDDSLPTLELSPSRLNERNEGYEEWYEVVAGCIRANFRRTPLKMLGGFIGPEAFKWFQDGGILLPMLAPPQTSEWMSFVENQHVGLPQ